MLNQSRRRFFQALGFGAGNLILAQQAFPEPYEKQATSLRKKIKITDVKCMIVRGTWDWNLIRIETYSGLYGVGEAYLIPLL